MHRSRNVNFLLRIICQDGLKLTVFRVFCKEQLVFMQQLFDAPWANRRPEHCRNMCRAGSGLWLNNAAFHRWCSLQLSLLQKCRKYKSVSATGRCWFPTSVHNVHHDINQWAPQGDAGSPPVYTMYTTSTTWRVCLHLALWMITSFPTRKKRLECKPCMPHEDNTCILALST